MAAEAANVLAALEMLNINLRRRQSDDLADDLGAANRRLTDLEFGILVDEQHPAKFEIAADLDITEIDVHDIALLNAILA
jgi:hypothetical protein